MRAIMILTLVLAIGLLATGCAKITSEKVITPQDSQTAIASDNSISGEISSVDSLDSELNSSDLGDVDAQLDEINW